MKKNKFVLCSLIKTRIILIFILMISLWQVCFGAAWLMSVQFMIDPSGVALYDTAYLGENPEATDTYDLMYDIAQGPPPQNPGYVQMYFAHSDWGTYAGNYKKDVRSATIVQKQWTATLKKNGLATTYSYRLSWVIPAALPGYYSPKLVIGTQTIDMRLQSSYLYTYSSSSNYSCVVRLDVNSTAPYISQEIPDQSYSDNLTREFNLSEYFGVLTGSLNYSFTANANLSQTIVQSQNTWYYRVAPIHNWQGSTTTTLTASTTGGSIAQGITVTRNSTNSLPVLTLDSNQFGLTQNHGSALSLVNKISDPDLDTVALSLSSNPNITGIWNPSTQVITITPNPGFKGQGNISIFLSDGVNSPREYVLAVTVYASAPQTVQNLSLSRGSSTCQLTWDPVQRDVDNLPIAGVRYKVEGFTTLPYDSANVIYQNFTSEASLQLPQLPDICFICVTTIND